jgi:hypothetical protein
MYLRRLAFLMLMAVVISSGCNKKKRITGDAFIPRDVFVEVLVDIHLMDGITHNRRLYRRYTDVDSIDVLGPILEKHHVTKEMFDTTLYEYSRYPELFDDVYQDVLMYLNIMLDQNDQEEEINIPEE